MKKVIILVPGSSTNVSSVLGTVEILMWANEYWHRLGNRKKLEFHFAGMSGAGRPEHGGVQLSPVSLEEVSAADLAIIPSLSQDYEQVIGNKELIAWIVQAYKKGAEIATICTGSFLLAATGLLNGHACSTHWEEINNFKRLFPKVEARTDTITYSAEGIFTNGGGYSYLNLLLMLVERYFDRPTAIYCSKMFQIDMDLTQQSPYAIFKPLKEHGDELISRVQSYIEENLASRISFEKLAEQLAISRRTLDRRFLRSTGNTPLDYLQRVRIEVAKNALESGGYTVPEVMRQVGYSDSKAFREVFRRTTGISPVEYLQKFERRNFKQVVD